MGRPGGNRSRGGDRSRRAGAQAAPAELLHDSGAAAQARAASLAGGGGVGGSARVLPLGALGRGRLAPLLESIGLRRQNCGAMLKLMPLLRRLRLLWRRRSMRLTVRVPNACSDASLLVTRGEPHPGLLVDLDRPGLRVARKDHGRDPAAVGCGAVLDPDPHSMLGQVPGARWLRSDQRRRHTIAAVISSASTGQD